VSEKARLRLRLRLRKNHGKMMGKDKRWKTKDKMEHRDTEDTEKREKE